MAEVLHRDFRHLFIAQNLFYIVRIVRTHPANLFSLRSITHYLFLNNKILSPHRSKHRRSSEVKGLQ